MIIVQLIGGLGNQLFQYALGKHLAQKNHVDLKLDITAFENYKIHKYSLNHFNIAENFATKNEINKLKGGFNYFFNFHKEKYYHFNSKILNIKKNAYLEGYWQSEKYFKDIENIIRDEFTIKTLSTDFEVNFSEEIKNRNSVSIHVRRGDYISNPDANRVHGLTPMEYYQKSIDYMVQKEENVHFYIFSDDHEWVEKNLKIEHNKTYVNQNDSEKNYEDLRLMSLCKHNIIANSSFSWWGAWLNNNKGKIVCYPSKWFNDKSLNPKDLIPESWIRI